MICYTQIVIHEEFIDQWIRGFPASPI